MNEGKARLSAISEWLGGRVARDAEFGNLGFAIHEGPGLLTWLEARRYLPEILANHAISAVIAPPALADLVPAGMGLLLHEKAREAFYRLHNHLALDTTFYGARKATTVHPEARVAGDAYVAPMGVEISEGAVVEPGARLLPDARIGPRAVIRAGAVIGSQGFQFAKIGGKLTAIEHVGGVRVEEEAEICANANVSRAIFRGDTVIGPQAKVDALVHIAHNVRVGARTSVVAGSVISGSVVIGNDVYIGPGVTVTNCIRIGNGARITMGSVVVRSVAPGQHVTGNWALPHADFMRAYGRFAAKPNPSMNKETP